ncbi:endonuclease/exonuclease/phosphatase family metal-dependent hydrolase [Chitinophaga dinghuensis]|uniref:Endonuclease/exonuclease/phosphatase family metal-dependent hydrolase n=1 Tax=Chitinophaga dinghuensis TaxID=1539050 RepID=A0A327W1Y2_9BACT|nr:endonuclease/exonuclease/phosphatase family protein [Chitinophaga dinghuensis]RAJ83297.1 endonuclease/exonuclease/phosphatase family metal-dependent hydrolase [Chitinophaga dinghuensis]
MKKLFIAAAALILGFKASAQNKITVLTYNTHHGANMKNEIDLAAIAKVINNAHPDLVALQEVDSVTSRTGKIDQLKELARLTGMYCYFGRSMWYDGGGYGTGILSKYPIKSAQTLQMAVGDGKEPRATGIITVELPGKKMIQFASTHLDVEDEDTWRLQEAKQLINFFSKSKYPVIIAGDFNAEPNTTEIGEFTKFFTDITANAGPSFPSDKPSIKLDYIMIHAPKTWKGGNAQVIDERIASDHRPVMADIQTK